MSSPFDDLDFNSFSLLNLVRDRIEQSEESFARHFLTKVELPLKDPQTTMRIVVQVKFNKIGRAKAEQLEEGYLELGHQIVAKIDKGVMLLLEQQLPESQTISEVLGAASVLKELEARCPEKQLDYVIPGSFWTEILMDKECVAALEPSTRMDAIVQGNLGTIFGHGLRSDAFRHPDQKILGYASTSVWCVPSAGKLGEIYVENSDTRITDTAESWKWSWTVFVQIGKIDPTSYAMAKIAK